MKALIAVVVIVGGLMMFWFLAPYIFTGGSDVIRVPAVDKPK